MYFNKVSIDLSNIREYNMSDLIHKRKKIQFIQTNNESFGSELWDESFHMSSCAFFQLCSTAACRDKWMYCLGEIFEIKNVLGELLSFLLYSYVPLLFTLGPLLIDSAI